MLFLSIVDQIFFFLNITQFALWSILYFVFCIFSPHMETFPAPSPFHLPPIRSSTSKISKITSWSLIYFFDLVFVSCFISSVSVHPCSSSEEFSLLFSPCNLSLFLRTLPRNANSMGIIFFFNKA